MCKLRTGCGSGRGSRTRRRGAPCAPGARLVAPPPAGRRRGAASRRYSIRVVLRVCTVPPRVRVLYKKEVFKFVVTHSRSESPTAPSPAAARAPRPDPPPARRRRTRAPLSAPPVRHRPHVTPTGVRGPVSRWSGRRAPVRCNGPWSGSGRERGGVPPRAARRVGLAARSAPRRAQTGHSIHDSITPSRRLSSEW
jgi:hypothetical protein